MPFHYGPDGPCYTFMTRYPLLGIVIWLRVWWHDLNKNGFQLKESIFLQDASSVDPRPSLRGHSGPSDALGGHRHHLGQTSSRRAATKDRVFRRRKESPR